MAANQETIVGTVFKEESFSLLKFLGRRISNYDDAEDLLQESYLRLHKAQSTGTVRNARGLLYRIATNLLIDKYRSLDYNVNRVSIDDTADEDRPVLSSSLPTPEQITITNQQLATLANIIETLPPRCRQVFELHRFKQLTHREIAASLGISTQMVEKHISKAVRICSGSVEMLV